MLNNKNYIINKIGSGKYTIVYCMEIEPNKSVAVKVLKPEYEKNRHFQERLIREGQIGKKLNDPSIRRVMDVVFDEEERTYQLVSEFIEGYDIGQYVEKFGKIPESQVFEWLRKILPALQSAHDKLNFHGLIKPSNLLIAPKGNLKIADFTGGYFEQDLFPEHIQGEDIQFLSPEQILQSGQISARSDIYSLGVSIYFMITGLKPFSGVTNEVDEVRIKVLNDALPFVDSVSLKLNSLIQTATAKNPMDRFQSALSMLDELEDRKPVKDPGYQAINLFTQDFTDEEASDPIAPVVDDSTDQLEIFEDFKLKDGSNDPKVDVPTQEPFIEPVPAHVPSNSQLESFIFNEVDADPAKDEPETQADDLEERTRKLWARIEEVKSIDHDPIVNKVKVLQSSDESPIMNPHKDKSPVEVFPDKDKKESEPTTDLSTDAKQEKNPDTSQVNSGTFESANEVSAKDEADIKIDEKILKQSEVTPFILETQKVSQDPKAVEHNQAAEPMDLVPKVMETPDDLEKTVLAVEGKKDAAAEIAQNTKVNNPDIPSKTTQKPVKKSVSKPKVTAPIEDKKSVEGTNDNNLTKKQTVDHGKQDQSIASQKPVLSHTTPKQELPSKSSGSSLKKIWPVLVSLLGLAGIYSIYRFYSKPEEQVIVKEKPLQVLIDSNQAKLQADDTVAKLSEEQFDTVLLADTGNLSLNELEAAKKARIEHLENQRRINEERKKQEEKAKKEIDVNKIEILGAYNSNVAPFKYNGLIGFVDRSKQVVVKPKYNDILSYSEGYAPVQYNSKWGFVDLSGLEIIKPIYDEIFGFSKGLAGVKKDGKWGYINRSGRMIVPNKYDVVTDFSAGLAGVRKNNKWGFVSAKGLEVIPCLYDNAWSFNDGLAGVEKGGKWGFINKNGEAVVPFSFDQVKNFSEGYALVEKNGKFGFIDKSGKQVIEAIYDNGKSFQNGTARVFNNGKWVYINKTGKCVRDCN